MPIDKTTVWRRRLAVDTGFLIRSLSVAHRDEECRELWEAMREYGASILIPAPVLVEFLRHEAAQPVPSVVGIEVVSFDERAAQLCGSTFTREVLSDSLFAASLKTCLKFDATIVACAKRHQAHALVTRESLSGNIDGLAMRVDLPVMRPDDFMEPGTLPLRPGQPM